MSKASKGYVPRTVRDTFCKGCTKSEHNQCTVYYSIPPMYMRAGQCPFNVKHTVETTAKVRVGQQKQRKK